MIYGRMVPCTHFLGTEGLTEEKKREMWIEVISTNVATQAIIERDIHFRGTKANTIYQQLMRNPSRTFADAELEEN